MTSPDLGSAFTACPDDTPKRLQAWFSAPITCACPTVAETVGAAFTEKMLRGAPFIPHQAGYRARPFWSVMIPRYNPHARRTKAGSSSSRTDARLKSHAVRDWIEACFREVGLDWNDYADSVDTRIPYYDITAFRESDGDLAAEFLEIERRERNNKPSYPG